MPADPLDGIDPEAPLPDVEFFDGVIAYCGDSAATGLYDRGPVCVTVPLHRAMAIGAWHCTGSHRFGTTEVRCQCQCHQRPVENWNGA